MTDVYFRSVATAQNISLPQRPNYSFFAQLANPNRKPTHLIVEEHHHNIHDLACRDADKFYISDHIQMN
jgi:hypothetical protein